MSLEVDMNNNQTKRPTPEYTLEFKRDAAKLVNEKGYTHQQAADNLGISSSAISRWSRAERGLTTPSTTKTAVFNLTGQAELLRLRKENEQLHREREILRRALGVKKAAVFPSASSGRALPRKSDKVRVYWPDGWPWGIREQQKTFPVTVLCRVMAVGASAFYVWLKTPADTDKVRQKEELEAKAHQLFNDHKHTYGYRRLSDALGKAGMKSG
jgi:transposase